MTDILMRRWPSSLTLADLGSHVVVTRGGEVHAGVLAAVVHCPRSARPKCPHGKVVHADRHTHVIVSSRAVVIADHLGTVLVTPRSTLDAATEQPADATPADAGHSSRCDRAVALARRAAARVRAGVVGAALATATGRTLTVLLAVALMWAGLEVAFTSPPTTLAQLLGAILFGAGGAVLIRLWQIANRMRGRR